MSIIDFLYSISGIVLILFYMPQIISVLRSKSGAQDVSITSYTVWTMCMVCSLLYGIYTLNDFKFSMFAGLNFACCFFIAAATGKKRIVYKKSKSGTRGQT